jgi:hypothetical protein
VIDQDHVLTDEDFETAKANGISKANLRIRFYRLYWDKEDCISIPVQPHKKHDGWRVKCKELGIVKLATFDKRMKYGWDAETAATTPAMTKEQVGERIRKMKRKYPKWVYEAIEKNNVPHKTFLNRMNSRTVDWTLEEACTAPKGMALADWRLRGDEHD